MKKKIILIRILLVFLFAYLWLFFWGSLMSSHSINTNLFSCLDIDFSKRYSSVEILNNCWDTIQISNWYNVSNLANWEKNVMNLNKYSIPWIVQDETAWTGDISFLIRRNHKEADFRKYIFFYMLIFLFLSMIIYQFLNTYRTLTWRKQ